MIDLSTQDHGILENCLDTPWLTFFIEKFKSKSVYENTNGYATWNSRIGSQEHSIFCNILANKLNFVTGFGYPTIIGVKFRNVDLGPHSDSLMSESFGQAHKTYLIPLNNFGSSSTFIFNQRNKNALGKDAMEEQAREMPVLPDDENACNVPDLDHIEYKIKQRISVKKQLHWKENSILFWDSDLLHCSCMYREEFGPSRNALVIWTIKNI